MVYYIVVADDWKDGDVREGICNSIESFLHSVQHELPIICSRINISSEAMSAQVTNKENGIDGLPSRRFLFGSLLKNLIQCSDASFSARLAILLS